MFNWSVIAVDSEVGVSFKVITTNPESYFEVIWKNGFSLILVKYPN